MSLFPPPCRRLIVAAFVTSFFPLLSSHVIFSPAAGWLLLLLSLYIFSAGWLSPLLSLLLSWSPLFDCCCFVALLIFFNAAWLSLFCHVSLFSPPIDCCHFIFFCHCYFSWSPPVDYCHFCHCSCCFLKIAESWLLQLFCRIRLIFWMLPLLPFLFLLRAVDCCRFVSPRCWSGGVFALWPPLASGCAGWRPDAARRLIVIF